LEGSLEGLKLGLKLGALEGADVGVHKPVIGASQGQNLLIL